jgi:endonuclease/exonuclease/phosphatase family metal-dependent hydrolase
VGVQNLWARYGDWPNRRRVLIDGLRRARPDLLAFVEPVKLDDYDQIVDLLGPDYHVVYQSNLAPDGVGCGLASRWPIGRVEEVDLRLTPRPPDRQTPALIAEIDGPEPLYFVTGTASWQTRFARERELQAVAIARRIEELAGDAHVVVAGDLDATPDSSSIRFWTGRQSLEGTSVCYRDAWESIHGSEPGHTFTPQNPLVASGETAWDIPRRIDYILVRCNDHGPTLDISSCDRLFHEPVDGVWASDHFGVVAELATYR